MIDKPPLEGVYLAHFGVKGMKWGRRKARSDDDERGKVFTKANGIKAAKAAAMVAGVAAVALVMTQSGRTKMVDIATTGFVQNRSARSAASNSPFKPLTSLFKEVKASTLPSPSTLRLDSQRFTDVQALRREGMNRLTDQTWRDQARMSQLVSQMNNTSNPLLDGSLSARLLSQAGNRR